MVLNWKMLERRERYLICEGLFYILLPCLNTSDIMLCPYLTVIIDIERGIVDFCALGITSYCSWSLTHAFDWSSR